METGELIPLLEQLEDNVDDLEEALQPLLRHSLSDTSKKMPLLDKAKLHVLVTYTLESLLFSYLRLHGVNSREHPVFRELTRVKQYFEKIKDLETGPEKRTMVLDKEAAGRFIKHGLSGNDKLDLERAEREAKEKAVAQLRARLLAKKNTTIPEKQLAVENHSSSSESDSGSDSDSSSDSNGSKNDCEKAQQSAVTGSLAVPKNSAKWERRERAKATKQVKNQPRKESRREKLRKKIEARRARNLEEKRQQAEKAAMKANAKSSS